MTVIECTNISGWALPPSVRDFCTELALGLFILSLAYYRILQSKKMVIGSNVRHNERAGDYKSALPSRRSNSVCFQSVLVSSC